MAIGMESEEAPKSSDLRLYARFECLEAARLDGESSDKSYFVKVVDVGLGGVQLQSSDPLPVDVLLTLRIEQEGEIVLRVPGHAKYSTPAEPGTYASGFKFSPSSHQERVDIAQFVHGIFQRQWEILAG